MKLSTLASVALLASTAGAGSGVADPVYARESRRRSVPMFGGSHGFTPPPWVFAGKKSRKRKK